MEKECFDQLFEEALSSAVKHSYERIDIPSAAMIRLSWQTFRQRRAGEFWLSDESRDEDNSGYVPEGN